MQINQSVKQDSGTLQQLEGLVTKDVLLKKLLVFDIKSKKSSFSFECRKA